LGKNLLEDVYLFQPCVVLSLFDSEPATANDEVAKNLGWRGFDEIRD